MTNFIPGWQDASSIRRMTEITVTVAMPSAPPVGDDGPRRNQSGLKWEPMMLTGMRARMAMIRMRMRRNKHPKWMMDQRRMWRTEGIVLERVKIGLYISKPVK
jgi:hypothetical protein